MSGKKEEIILIGAELIHEYGYHNVGIKKILDVAQIPKGSFYHYFKSKEDLALCIIDFHINRTKAMFSSVDESKDGLKEFFNMFFNMLRSMDYKKGCPVGNLILELADEKETFRIRLLEWLRFLENGIGHVLKKENIESPESKAAFIVATFEGIIMNTKLEKSDKYFKVFHDHIFNDLLK
ncbi:TetR/AcrR family transcriptional regulator [Anaeromicrobium sediminis]|uniref:HTH tetR-type domain-containing protein n=1 Tax=Anaeromicrobium sediminis TaxID=1478221 RepID=A0A267MK79_9FIRM|nr:TetR/AcrR family transcriptional regulator [Anaeromicrobium sediminis]PAB59822.1 hypothetical protein CCE28_07655 [Anaeromicrobium sediminis]